MRGEQKEREAFPKLPLPVGPERSRAGTCPGPAVSPPLIGAVPGSPVGGSAGLHPPGTARTGKGWPGAAEDGVQQGIPAPSLRHGTARRQPQVRRKRTPHSPCTALAPVTCVTPPVTPVQRHLCSDTCAAPPVQRHLCSSAFGGSVQSGCPHSALGWREQARPEPPQAQPRRGGDAGTARVPLPWPQGTTGDMDTCARRTEAFPGSCSLPVKHQESLSPRICMKSPHTQLTFHPRAPAAVHVVHRKHPHRGNLPHPAPACQRKPKHSWGEEQRQIYLSEHTLGSITPRTLTLHSPHIQQHTHLFPQLICKATFL